MLGIFVIQKEDADAAKGPEDVGVVIEGVVLCGLGSVANACALLFVFFALLNIFKGTVLNKKTETSLCSSLPPLGRDQSVST